MSRTIAEKKDFTFVAGLNTEAGFQTFPENAWLDADNITPVIDGSVERRTKLDLESAFVLSTNSNTSSQKQNFAYSIHRWDSAGGDGGVSLVVVQQGDFVRFYGNSQASLSLNEKSFSIDLNTYNSGGGLSVFGTSEIHVAQGNGKLIIVSKDTDPILVEYNVVADTITVTRLTLKFRDFAGLEDGLAPDNRPATLSKEHNYNLLNQGWLAAHITTYFTADAVYPSNAQIWTSGKDATNTFTAAQLDKQFFGTSLAPRGHFVLDVFNRDRTTASGVAAITTEVEKGRPTTVSFFAGRAWYAGVNSSSIGSWVLFSQIVASDNKKYERCYQSGDPTAEFTSDLIASDGGIIPIPEAGEIIKLVAIQDSLLVFAQNGVWQIDGGSSGFTADLYHVHKVCPFGCIGPDTIIEVEGALLFWSNGDIFALKRSINTAGSGDFFVESISFAKIHTLYSSIPVLSKQFAQGFYDIDTKKVFWMFKKATSLAADNTIIDRFTKDKFLVFDTRLGAFYIYSIASITAPSPVIIGGLLANVSSGASVNVFNVIITNLDNVIVTSGDSVIGSIDVSSGNISSRISKFLTLVPSGSNWKLSFADFSNTLNAPDKFKDWFSFNSVGAEPSPLPFLLTGWATGGDGSKIHQAPYLLTFMKRTETGFTSGFDAVNQSSCIMQGKWEWTDSAVASRWTLGEEIYRHRPLFVPVDQNSYVDGYPLVVAKTKIRGRGRALNIKFTSTSGKDMKLTGWSVLYQGNSSV